MVTPDDRSSHPQAPLERGIHPLHLLFLIACAALSFPILFYVFFLLLLLLMPGQFD